MGQQGSRHPVARAAAIAMPAERRGRRKAAQPEHCQPEHIPEELVVDIEPDPVQSQHPVEQHDVREVPEPEAGERLRRQAASRHRKPGRGPLAPDQPQAGERHAIHHKVEQPVGKDLDTDVPEGDPIEPAEQVVPLQDLVQQDAVEESAQADAQQNTAEGGSRRRGAGRGVGNRHAGGSSRHSTSSPSPTRPTGTASA